MRQTKNMNKASGCANPGQRAKRRILVVEDNKSVQHILSIILGSMGFEVALAKNGLEAFTLFVESSFDVVLTDLQMPIMDGSRLAHLIKEMSPATPVILLTGADMATVKEKAESGLLDSVMFKPFKIDDLQNAVQGALGLREAEQTVMRAV
jgi:CheY-like chemotaxis protein